MGLSQVDLATIKKAQAICPLGAIQNLYNMMERDAEQIIPYLKENNIALVPFSPTASGLLSGKINSDTKFEKQDDVRIFVPQLSKENIEGNKPFLDELKKIADKHHATMAQISLAWMIRKYDNVIPIPGSKNKERIIENLKSAEVDLTREEAFKIDESLKKYKIHGHRGMVETQQHTFLDLKDEAKKLKEK